MSGGPLALLCLGLLGVQQGEKEMAGASGSLSTLVP